MHSIGTDTQKSHHLLSKIVPTLITSTVCSCLCSSNPAWNPCWSLAVTEGVQASHIKGLCTPENSTPKAVPAQAQTKAIKSSCATATSYPAADFLPVHGIAPLSPYLIPLGQTGNGKLHFWYHLCATETQRVPTTKIWNPQEKSALSPLSVHSSIG